jgi:hypothetical protein
MECYRKRSKAVPFRPIATAYADAAKDLEEMIAGLGAASSLSSVPAPPSLRSLP